MNNIYRTVKERFSLLVGAGSFTYGLFSFISVVTRTTRLAYREDDINISLIYLVAGVIFMTLGLIKINNGKKN